MQERISKASLSLYYVILVIQSDHRGRNLSLAFIVEPYAVQRRTGLRKFVLRTVSAQKNCNKIIIQHLKYDTFQLGLALHRPTCNKWIICEGSPSASLILTGYIFQSKLVCCADARPLHNFLRSQFSSSRQTGRSCFSIDSFPQSASKKIVVIVDIEITMRCSKESALRRGCVTVGRFAGP